MRFWHTAGRNQNFRIEEIEYDGEFFFLLNAKLKSRISSILLAAENGPWLSSHAAVSVIPRACLLQMANVGFPAGMLLVNLHFNLNQAASKGFFSADC